MKLVMRHSCQFCVRPKMMASLGGISLQYLHYPLNMLPNNFRSMPALIVNDGTILYESLDICNYLAEVSGVSLSTDDDVELSEATDFLFKKLRPIIKYYITKHAHFDDDFISSKQKLAWLEDSIISELDFVRLHEVYNFIDVKCTNLDTTIISYRDLINFPRLRVLTLLDHLLPLGEQTWHYLKHLSSKCGVGLL